MIRLSEKAGFHLTYSMYIMEDMISFIKNYKNKTIDEQYELLKQHRWLGTKYFLPLGKQWLQVCKDEEMTTLEKGNP